MKVSELLRHIVKDYYLHGSGPLGRDLEALIPRVEALERAASPVSDENAD